ncbi:hypothetical protein [Noviherbaspirillum malthae]|uniref:hypothetical protein n=1 Tax=Noviherbaspirillum malthae TaxID=1260987 RepID=UPI001E3D5D8A|nr:hypothetical protein [Noviherbaspirillum malthae]
MAKSYGGKHEYIVTSATIEHVVTVSSGQDVIACTTDDGIGQVVACASKCTGSSKGQVFDIGCQDMAVDCGPDSVSTFVFSFGNDITGIVNEIDVVALA